MNEMQNGNVECKLDTTYVLMRGSHVKEKMFRFRRKNTNVYTSCIPCSHPTEVGGVRDWDVGPPGEAQ